MPWQPSDGDTDAAEALKVEDMISLVETLLENTATDDEKAKHCITFALVPEIMSDFKFFECSKIHPTVL